ncbi:MAG: Rv3654c family TadE-like protein [Actinomycetes bacterium]
MKDSFEGAAPPRGQSRRRGDDGAALVWALALVVLIMTAGLIAAAVAQQGLVRQHVASAADVAALAGAQALGDACDEARRLAVANGTALVDCALDGPDVVVRVSRPAPPLVVRLFTLLGSSPPEVVGVARAGPPQASTWPSTGAVRQNG